LLLYDKSRVVGALHHLTRLHHQGFDASVTRNAIATGGLRESRRPTRARATAAAKAELVEARNFHRRRWSNRLDAEFS